MSNVSTATSQKSKSIATVFGIKAPATVNIEGDFGPGSNVKVDPDYVFRPWLVKLLMMWWSGRINQRMYLFGPTGSGKSTVIEQFGAVMGYPVFRIGVHNRLEFNETMGCVQLVPINENTEDDVVDNSKSMFGVLSKMVSAIKRLANSSVVTKFVHAELGQGLVSSKSHKVIVLIDEVDQGHPSQNMAWNKLLDQCPMTLPTGEVISPDNIWIAATGNTAFEDERGLYRGTQRQNIAFKSRFGIHEEISYPDKEVEEAILAKVSKTLDAASRAKMVDFAIDMRKLFVSCDLDVPLATRTLVNWAKMSEALNGMPGVSPFKRALELTFSNQCSSEDKEKIAGAWQRFSGE
jgi:cobaltochelatase CobS